MHSDDQSKKNHGHNDDVPNKRSEASHHSRSPGEPPRPPGWILEDPDVIEQIDHNALKLSKRCGYSSSDIEDIKQDIRLHLFQKESAYDPERGTPGAYANHIVKTWLWTKLKYLNQQCRKGRMYKWSFLPAEEPLDPRGLDQVVDSAVASELLTTALAQLSSQDVWVVRLTREHGQVRASKLLGIKRRQLRHQLRFVSAICSDLHSFSEKAAKP